MSEIAQTFNTYLQSRIIYPMLFEMFKYLISIILLFISTSLFSQKQTTDWFLRNGNRVNFNNKTLAVSPNTNIAFNKASASICDSAGNLLFVSNGIKIYDKNLQVMPALQDTAKRLNSIAGKHIIVKMPNSSSKYYLFYPDGEANYDRLKTQYYDSVTIHYDTIKYAIIDMALNGGLGDVVSYNNVLIKEKSAQFTTIQKENSEDFWIITHKNLSDSFYTNYVNNSGIATPVIQSVGLNSIKSDYVLFTMQPSWNGKYLAIASQNTYRWAPWPSTAWDTYMNVELYNFDNTTGKLTTKLKTPREDIVGGLSDDYFHKLDIIFSPNNNLFYFASYYGNNDGAYINISQFNTKNCGDSIEFYKSGFRNFVVVKSYPIPINDSVTTYFCGNFQLANNGKIYYGLGNKKIFGVISNPNCIGSYCNAGDTSLPINNPLGSTMPTFHHKYVEASFKNNIIYKGGCLPSPQTFEVSNSAIASIFWNFGDPLSGTNDTSTLLKPTHIFTAPGYCTIKAILYDGGGNFIDSISRLIHFVDPTKRLLSGYPKDTTLCEDQVIKFNFDVYDGLVTKGGYINNVFTNFYGVNKLDLVAENFKFYFELKQNDCDGCVMRDSITMHVVSKVNAALGADRNLCSGDSIKLVSNNLVASSVWSTGDTSQIIWVKQGGTYWLQVANGYCSASDTVKLTAVPNVNFNLPKDTTLCNNQTLLLKPGLTGVSYLWQNNTINNSFLVKQAGLYWLTITNSYNCKKTDSIKVEYITSANVYLDADTAICRGDSLKLQPNVNSNYYLWSTGSTAPFIYVKDTSKYWVEVKNSNCLVRDTIKVLVNEIPIFNLGMDTGFCEGSNVILNTKYIGADSYLWNTGKNAQQISADTSGKYWCIITKNKCTYSDTVNVVKNLLPKFSLGADTTYCGMDSIVLTNNTPNINTYLWQDGGNGKFYTAKNTGLYWLSISDKNGCKYTDSIKLSLNQFPNFKFSSDSISFCDGAALLLTATTNNAKYKWNTNDTTDKLLVAIPGTYWCEVYGDGCKKSDSIKVTRNPIPKVYLGNDTTICGSSKLILDAKNSGANYQWNTGDKTQKLIVNSTGEYSVNIERGGCFYSDTIIVSHSDIPSIFNFNDTNFCKQSSVFLTPMTNVNDASFLWNNGSVNKSLEVNQVGNYKVKVYNNCGFAIKQVLVTEKDCFENIPNAFSPNGDGINDTWQIPSLSAYPHLTITIFDRYGRKVFNSTGYKKAWNGTSNGKPLPTGTYYYIINTNADLSSKTLSGSVTILR